MDREPRILVVSNNSFSLVRNNGKTLASLFRSYQSRNIAQLYFDSSQPIWGGCHTYFRVSDFDVLKSLYSSAHSCGQPIAVSAGHSDCASNASTHGYDSIRRSEIMRCLRELMWSARKWDSSDLRSWVGEFNPDIVFLCGGDAGFAYDIARTIAGRCQATTVLFLTDDYILPRGTLNVVWWIRRYFLLRRMRSFLAESSGFVTISERMRCAYRAIFVRDSFVVGNVATPLCPDQARVEGNLVYKCVYAGGLAHNRHQTIGLFVDALVSYNRHPESEKKVFLEIYSSSLPSKAMLQNIEVEGVSRFCGEVGPIQLNEVLNNCDVLLFVESFDKASMAATKLSMSTKIPEFLSLGKPILAIGPSEVSSIDYLQDVSFCITDVSSIYSNVGYFFDNKEMWGQLATRALIKYRINHNPETTTLKFREWLAGCIDSTDGPSDVS